MKKTKRGLGTDAIFGANSIRTFDEILKKNVQEQPIVKVKLKDLSPNPNQPRKEFSEDSLETLARSLKVDGLIQPIVINRNNNIIVGERRVRAAKKLGWTEIDAKIMNVTQERSALLAISENINREDINPIEEAHSYKVLSYKFGLTQEQIAKQFNKSRGQIANYMRLLKLPLKVQEMLIKKQITVGHAKELLAYKDDKKIISEAIAIQKNKKTVRDVGAKKNKAKEKQTNKETLFLKKLNCKLISTKKKITLVFNKEQDLKNLLMYLKKYK